ncbi:hypothetical protein K5X82_07150 [Halosquirtibacter xylanolyticus]|uniref:hypothetical protein n=1 Tax=Halosquirtibacter xylanolyticus TaxID=3374599 RepID=UPI003749F28D|nr:hypothetical protein K5X82_07150 [Prolixibacteraceae bacterium]
MSSFMSSGYRAVFTPTPQRILISYYLDSANQEDRPAFYGEIQGINNLISLSTLQCSLSTPHDEEILLIKSQSTLFSNKWNLYGRDDFLIGKVLTNNKTPSVMGQVQCNEWGTLGRIQYSNHDKSCVITRDDQTFGSIDFVDTNNYHFHLDGSIKNKKSPNLLFLGLAAIVYAIQNTALIPYS